MRIRAGVVIMEDGKLALIERVREERTYYLFPGGGVEPGETPEQAAVREAYEELGVRIEVGPPVARVAFNGGIQIYYIARSTGGEFGTGDWPEMRGPGANERGTYKATWVAFNDLATLDVRPRALALAAPGWAEQGTPAQVVEWEE